MRGVNKAIILGHLGSDPDVRYTADQRVVVTLSVATSSSWKDSVTGEQQTDTEWHRVVLFNRLAQIAADYLKKGAMVYIEGSLQTKQWQDKSGNSQQTTQIVARQLEMLSAGDQSSQDPPDLDVDLPF